MENKTPISAFIICCNEEQDIRRSLQSISWCDEIIVVDSGSTDNTLEIAQEFNVTLIKTNWRGYSKQKEYALKQCTHNWVLNIDADEEVSEELKHSILTVLSQSAEKQKLTAGYQVCRMVYFLDKWWNKGGWYPEYRLRLVQKNKTKWAGRDPHERATVSGETKKLSGHLYHYTYKDFADQIKTLNNFSSRSAELMYEDGKRANIVNILINPPTRFLKFFIFKRGFREGLPGLFIAINESYYVFLKYIKLWEIGHKEKTLNNPNSKKLRSK